MDKHNSLTDAMAEVAKNVYFGGGSSPAGVPIKQVSPPDGEDTPEIIYGFYKPKGGGFAIAWDDPDAPKQNLSLTRNLNDVIKSGAKQVLIFKFDRLGTINIEVV